MATTSSVAFHLGLVGVEDEATHLAPQMTFWAGERYRHMHFVIDYNLMEYVSPTWGTELKFKVDKHFDLWRKAWLVVDLPQLNAGAGGARWCDDVGRAMWNTIKLTSAQITINTLYPELDHALEELEVDPQNQAGQLTGKCDTVAELIDRARAAQRLYIPINFYCFKEDQDAFPLVNIMGSDIIVNVALKTAAQCIVSTTASEYTPSLADQTLTAVSLLMEVVWLPATERASFIDGKFSYYYQNYDYMVQQLPSGSTSASVKMEFNHPIKDLIVMFRKASKGAVPSNVHPSHNYFDFSGDEATAPFQGEAFATMQLKLNSNAYWRPFDAHFFRKVLCLTRYGRIPRKHIYPYPFGLYPGQTQPTGSCNFSKIDSRLLNFTFGTALTAATDVLIFTRHWNRIDFVKNGIQVAFS
jgi:hypothetical protein